MWEYSEAQSCEGDFMLFGTGDVRLYTVATNKYTYNIVT